MTNIKTQIKLMNSFGDKFAEGRDLDRLKLDYLNHTNLFTSIHHKAIMEGTIRRDFLEIINYLFLDSKKKIEKIKDMKSKLTNEDEIKTINKLISSRDFLESEDIKSNKIYLLNTLINDNSANAKMDILISYNVRNLDKNGRCLSSDTIINKILSNNLFRLNEQDDISKRIIIYIFKSIENYIKTTRYDTDYYYMETVLKYYNEPMSDLIKRMQYVIEVLKEIKYDEKAIECIETLIIEYSL